MGVSAKDPILQVHQAAALGADPEAAIPCCQNAEDTIVCQSGHIRVVIQMEVRSVEAQQAASCPYPEVPVLGLLDRLHRIFGKAVLDAPDAARILHGRIGIRSVCARGPGPGGGQGGLLRGQTRE